MTDLERMTAGRWFGRWRLAWQRARASLWFLPALLVIAAGGLSTVMLELDDVLGTGYARGWWLFGGTADGARTILSVIAGSLITVIAVAFSVTMIALQQASTQFTPRVLRNFTRDRGNQIVLGTYIATFAYALLVLRRVRASGAEGGEFVPSIAISVAMLMSLVSLALLVYFIHHVSDSLQVSTLLSAIRRELDGEIRRMFPESTGREAEEPPAFEELVASVAEAKVVTVRSAEEGYLRHIDQEQLGAKLDGARLVRIDVAIGHYLYPNDALFRAWIPKNDSEAQLDCLRWAFHLDRERSVEQDPLFGIQQLVDIAVKALSPGVNDPTTAAQALDQIGGTMTLLLNRSLRSPLRIIGQDVPVLFHAPDLGDFVHASFAQIRRAARADIHVSLHLIQILGRLIDTCGGPRAAPLRQELESVRAGLDVGALTESERNSLHFGCSPGETDRSGSREQWSVEQGRDRDPLHTRRVSEPSESSRAGGRKRD